MRILKQICLVGSLVLVGIILHSCIASTKWIRCSGPCAVWQDSLILTGHLSDTVFSFDELREFVSLSREDRTIQGWTKSPDSIKLTRRPLLQLEVTNISARDLTLQSKRLCSGLSARPNFWDQVTFFWGREGDTSLLKPPPGVVTSVPQCRDQYILKNYSTVTAGQTCLLEGPLNIVGQSLDYLGDRPITPGHYWIVARYAADYIPQNRRTYWTGVISTDTLRFRVRE